MAIMDGDSNWDILPPNSVPDGQYVCGMQSVFGQSQNGGVYQLFTWTGGTAQIAVTARAYSVSFPGLLPYDNGCDVLMGLVALTPGDSNGDQGVEFPWSSWWVTEQMQVPGPGTYMLFIEGYEPVDDAIISTLWDDVVWTNTQPINATSGPTVTIPGDPTHPDLTVLIAWTTDLPSTSVVEYGTTISYGQAAGVPTDLTTSHSVLITGLSHSTAYHFCAVSSNPGYVNYNSPDMSFSTPINILNITTGLASDGVSTLITWTTDANATSQVAYGLTPSMGSQTAWDNASTSHQVTISGLQQNSTYYFQISAAAPLYTGVVSALQTLQTLPNPTSQLRNGSFENSYAGQPSLFPWVQYRELHPWVLWLQAHRRAYRSLSQRRDQPVAHRLRSVFPRLRRVIFRGS